MFNSTLQSIVEREKYIDQLSENQISTILTKELFLKASQQTSKIYQINQVDSEQPIFRSTTTDDPVSNILKHILPSPSNSFQEIEQIQARLKLFNDKKLNQVEIIREIFENQKQAIKQSGLNVSDFLELYESEEMEKHQKNMNDPLIKKIIAHFETNTKEFTLYELLNLIIDGIYKKSPQEIQQNTQVKAIKKIRQSLCHSQGLSIQDGQDNSFNEQTKKQLQKIVAYYESIQQIFNTQVYE